MIGGVISKRMADKISAAYCCAACWSPLIIFLHVSGEHEGLQTLQCEYCGENVPGYVTRRNVEYRIEQRREEYEQAKEALKDRFPNLFPPPPPVSKPMEGYVRKEGVHDFLWNMWLRVCQKAEEKNIPHPVFVREEVKNENDLIQPIKELEFKIKSLKLENQT